MNQRLFPRMAFTSMLITSFLFIPFSSVYAEGYEQNTEYWRWWYVENITDKVSDGQGASADGITDTYNGSTVGQYVYDTTGITSDDVKEYVQQQYENATGYVEHTSEWYSSAIDDIWNSSIDAGTKAKYQAEKAIRETVDTAGNAIVDVSSSDYWSNVYNNVFNGGGYADQYVPSDNESYTGDVSGHTFAINWFGVCGVPADAGIENPVSDVLYIPSDCRFANDLISYDNDNFWDNTVGLSFSVDGNQYYIYRATSFQGWFGGYDGVSINGNVYKFNFHWIGRSGTSYNDGITVYFTSTPTNQGTQFQPVLQPKQVGFVFHNGIKYPVYTDPSLNPFKVNDDGTVTFDDGTGNENIYIDPSQLTDDGSLDILDWLDNENLTENPYNPFGKPWNTKDDGSILGGFFSNLVNDISSIFDGIGKMISNLIDKIIKAIKDIANIIIDALKKFWNMLIGDIEEYPSLFETDVDDNFDMISDLYDLLLECMGVDA